MYVAVYFRRLIVRYEELKKLKSRFPRGQNISNVRDSCGDNFRLFSWHCLISRGRFLCVLTLCTGCRCIWFVIISAELPVNLPRHAAVIMSATGRHADTRMTNVGHLPPPWTTASPENHDRGHLTSVVILGTGGLGRAKMHILTRSP